MSLFIDPERIKHINMLKQHAPNLWEHIKKKKANPLKLKVNTLKRDLELIKDESKQKDMRYEIKQLEEEIALYES